MGNFETIVRPVIFPNIRPAAPRSVAPESDPEKGFARINGQGGKIVSLPYNFTHQISRQKPREQKRRVDEVKVYQKEDNGNVRRDVFLALEILNKLWMMKGGARGVSSNPKATVDTSGPGSGTPGVGSANLEETMTFARQQPADNIEIVKRDVIKKNPDYIE